MLKAIFLVTFVIYAVQGKLIVCLYTASFAVRNAKVQFITGKIFFISSLNLNALIICNISGENAGFQDENKMLDANENAKIEQIKNDIQQLQDEGEELKGKRVVHLAELLFKDKSLPERCRIQNAYVRKDSFSKNDDRVEI